jgi:hypothetical protein
MIRPPTTGGKDGSSAEIVQRWLTRGSQTLSEEVSVGLVFEVMPQGFCSGIDESVEVDVGRKLASTDLAVDLSPVARPVAKRANLNVDGHRVGAGNSVTSLTCKFGWCSRLTGVLVQAGSRCAS